MNLPTTKPIITNVFLDIIDPVKLFLDLNEKKFTGYLYLVVLKENFLENIIFLEKGNVVGSIYINDYYNFEIYGKDAFKLSINSISLKEGLFNIFQLTEEQLKLLLIFNEKIKYLYKITKKTINEKTFIYDDKLIYNYLKEEKYKKEKTKPELFEKFKIKEILR
jgi:hypothetical protein